MEKTEFFEKLAEILEVPSIDESFALGPGAIDSLQVLSIISLIDEAFGTTVPAKQLTAAPDAGALWELAKNAQ